MADPITPEAAVDTSITSSEQAYTAWQAEPDKAELKDVWTSSQLKIKDSLAAYKADVAKQLEKPKPPDKYDLKIPSESLLDPSITERISAYAKEKGLSNEAAQELLNRDHDAVSTHHAALQKQVDDVHAAWLKEASEDKEIGPELKKNAELGKRVLDKFGSDALKKALNESGFGDHPEVIRFFFRIGKLMSEDSFIHAGTQNLNEKSTEEAFYPTMAGKA